MNNPPSTLMARRSKKSVSAARIRMLASLAAIVGLGAASATLASCTADDRGWALRQSVVNSGLGGGGGGSGGDPDAGEVEAGEACTDGSKRDCHVTISEHNGVLTCLNGTRTCENGVWGPCVGTFAARVTSPDEFASSEAAQTGLPNSEHAPEFRPLSLSDAGVCVNNPCDPNCQAYVEIPPLDAGFVSVPIPTVEYVSGSLEDALALNPPGFVNKGMKTPCNQTADCQFDSKCVNNGTNGVVCPAGANRCCVAWGAGEFNPSCAKPDLTTGFACTVGGLPTIPVCNRGSVTAQPPIRVYVFPGNAPQFPQCDPNDNPKNECLVNVPIPAGKCININNCTPQFGGNGTRTTYVNPPKTTNVGKPNSLWKDECTCQNNWGVWSGDSAICYDEVNWSAQPVIKNEVYQAICPQGTRPQWQFLTWNTTTPLDSNVLWDARVAATNAGLTSATYINLGNAKATPTPNTQICAVGVTGCPINLFTTFGGSPAANSEFLELRMTINPSTDKTQGARVNTWQITYTCTPTL